MYSVMLDTNVYDRLAADQKVLLFFVFGVRNMAIHSD